MKWLPLLFVTASTALFAAGAPDLLTAVRNGDHARVRKLLQSGADVNKPDGEGTTALMHAAIESDVAMMKLLVEGGADVNAKNAVESTALLYAATDMVKTRLLLDAGANTKVKNKRGTTPMSVAAIAYGSAPVLKLLAEKGAEPDNRLMAAAAQRGDLEAMEYLLSLGVSPSGVDAATTLSAALGSRCEACVRLLLEKGAPAGGAGGANGQGGVLSQTAKRAMTEMSQLVLDHGAKLDVKDRDNFTLLMQAVISMQPPADRDRMVAWLLAKGADANAKSARGETPYLLAARLGAKSTMDLLVKAGAQETQQEWPKPAGAASPQAAVERALPLIEMSGEAMFKQRGCVSCHSNSVPAMTVALARQKGFRVNDAQAKKELGFAVETDKPYLESMRMGSTIGGGSDTLGYTLMGMAAARYPADALTDAHIHYLAIFQYADGSWRPGSYRPPAEYSPFSTTAVALRAIRLYPLPGRRAEFEERFARAKHWLLTHAASCPEERAMQLNGLASAGASRAERAPYVKALKAAQNEDGSWSQLDGTRGDAYATGESLYALHVSGEVTVKDPVYQKGVEWLLRNQLADGTWFVPTRATPLQPHLDTGFPHGENQFASDAGSSWASMALLFTLPDKP